MFLVDTNILLEVMLEQERSEEAAEFLHSIDPKLLHITDFSLYSIGIILTRLKEFELFEEFTTDIIGAGIEVLHLPTADICSVIDPISEYQLDFDDAYQYCAAREFDLTIVSFDTDFDKTKKGRISPKSILDKGSG